jgi:hypothetical protein
VWWTREGASASIFDDDGLLGALIALFRTLKHTPVYPRLPFADLVAAYRRVARFVD